MPSKNVTISIPEPLWKKARAFAQEHGKTLSALVREQLETLLRQREELNSAHREISRAAERYSGRIEKWSRKGLYEI